LGAFLLSGVTMSDYPEYVERMLAQARAMFKDESCADSKAVSICYDILVLIPGCKTASDLILEGLSKPWLIRDNRKAISRLIDEWDDRPWQQRHRLALSFGYFSQWPHRVFEHDEDRKEILADVRDMLEEGDRQLLQTYLSGIERAAEVAWAIFQEGIHRARNPREVILWVANNYAHKGFFGEAMDILETAYNRFPQDDETCHLWAEVRWWRDYQHRIAWIPPDGDGSRYENYLAKYDRERWEFEKTTKPRSREYRPPDPAKLPLDFVIPQPLPDELEAQINQIIKKAPTIPSQSSMDWSYLKQLESGDIDMSKFPEWVQDLLGEVEDPELRAACAADFLERFFNPENHDEEEDHEDEY
jgi:hypothetical protein